MSKLLALLLIPSIGFGASQGLLVLKGTVAQILDISITPETNATSLPLTTAQNNLKVATVTERSNNANGYSVKITSSNLGKLVLNLTNFLNYTATYNNQTVALTSSNGTTFSNVFTNAAPVNRDFRISYNPIDTNSVQAGDYTDTITFTITAN